MIVPRLPRFRIDNDLVEDARECGRLWDGGEVRCGLVVCVELLLGEGVGELLEVLVESQRSWNELGPLSVVSNGCEMSARYEAR